MGSADKLFTDGEAYEHPYPRPLSGGKVEHLPSALLPARTALIGRYVTLEPLDAARHEIGSIWFGLTLRRTRSATESIYLMLRYAMDDLGYRRMQWRCNALNAASRVAARRLGFRFEGIFYNHMIFKGRNRDTAWYSILDDEWPEVRKIMERWLAPSNFDQDGMAKTSLAALMEKRGPSRRV